MGWDNVWDEERGINDDVAIGVTGHSHRRGG
jgi:hypothetical protein